MDSFEAVLRRGLTGVTQGAPLLAAGLVSGIVYAIGMFYTVDVNTADTPTMILGAIISFLPLAVVPYLTGGALGCALEASAGGKPGWPTFFASANKHYLSLFTAGIAIFAITLLFSFVMLISMADITLFCMIGLLTLLALFVTLMFLEFYDVSIVSENLRGMQGLGASVAFVRKNLGRVLPFFLIVLVAKLFVQLPAFAAQMLQMAAEIGTNYSLYINNTTGGMNMSYFNTTAGLQLQPLSTPTLLSIAVLQILVQTIVFAFVVSYKAEFYRWAKSIKKITDFDYDFSDEKKA